MAERYCGVSLPFSLVRGGVDFGLILAIISRMIIEAEKREGRKAESLRRDGFIPAVYYGPKEESTPISIKTAEFKKLWKGSGESSVINIKVDGKELEALIHEVAFHPVSGEPLHADFYVIEKGKKVTVDVGLDFIGVSPAVKELGGMIVKVMHEIEIEAMPKDLPHSIDVDISVLTDFEKHIAIKDLKLPEGVRATADPEDMVVMVHEAKEEVEEEPVEMDLDSIEVEKKGKEEEGEESSGEGQKEEGEKEAK
jgi:large subunit ribosomal protein L25